MFVVANRFRVVEEHADEFVERFRTSMGAVEEQPGFVRFEFLAPADDDTETYVAMTHWESEADFEAWTESEDFRDAHDDRPPGHIFEGHPELERHEVVVERE